MTGADGWILTEQSGKISNAAMISDKQIRRAAGASGGVMMERFWKWVRSYANNKVREIHFEKYHHERRCERCDTWTSEVDGRLELNDDPSDNMFELMTCKKCGHVSKWDCRGMIPELVKSYER